MNFLILNLSDDEQTKQIRLLIKSDYENLLSFIEKKIQTILNEHQSNFFY